MWFYIPGTDSNHQSSARDWSSDRYCVRWAGDSNPSYRNRGKVKEMAHFPIYPPPPKAFRLIYIKIAINNTMPPSCICHLIQYQACRGSSVVANLLCRKCATFQSKVVLYTRHASHYSFVTQFKKHSCLHPWGLRPLATASLRWHLTTTGVSFGPFPSLVWFTPFSCWGRDSTSSATTLVLMMCSV